MFSKELPLASLEAILGLGLMYYLLLIGTTVSTLKCLKKGIKRLSFLLNPQFPQGLLFKA